MNAEDERNGGATPEHKSAHTDQPPGDAWERLRGILKDVYAELGGGEAYLRKERESFELAERLREMHLGRLPVTKRDV
jgi:hypothetical protein